MLETTAEPAFLGKQLLSEKKHAFEMHIQKVVEVLFGGELEARLMPALLIRKSNVSRPQFAPSVSRRAVSKAWKVAVLAVSSWSRAAVRPRARTSAATDSTSFRRGAVGDDDVGTGIRAPQSDVEPKTSAAAGDEVDFVLEGHFSRRSARPSEHHSVGAGGEMAGGGLSEATAGAGDEDDF